MISGFLIIILWKWVVNGSSIAHPALWDGVISGIVFIVWGCTGILWMYRKEIPSKELYPINGKIATIIGGIVTIGFCGYGIYLIISSLITWL
jgi:hypothetical protein